MDEKDITQQQEAGNRPLEQTATGVNSPDGAEVVVPAANTPEMPPSLPAAVPGSRMDKWQNLAYITSAATGGALAARSWAVKPLAGLSPEDVALAKTKKYEDLIKLTPEQHTVQTRIAGTVRKRNANILVGGLMTALPVLHDNQVYLLDKFNDTRDLVYQKMPEFIKNNATMAIYGLQLAGNAASLYSGYQRKLPMRFSMGLYATAMSAALTFLGEEKKLSDEEKERLAEMSWPAYMKEQGKLAVDFLNPDHFGKIHYKRQFLGMLLGTISIWGFFVGRQSGNVAEQYGLLTRNMASMAALTFERDDAAAWTYYSALALPGLGLQYMQGAGEFASVASKMQPKHMAYPVALAQASYGLSTLFSLFGIQRTPDLPEEGEEPAIAPAPAHGKAPTNRVAASSIPARLEEMPKNQHL